jgi:hypothetical protein
MPRTITGATEKDRQPISLRLRPGLRDRVWAAANKEMRSLNDTANTLIERGLDRPETVFGSVNGYTVARLLINAADAAVAQYGAQQGQWVCDPKNFDRAVVAINKALELLRPVPEAQAEARAEIAAAQQQYLRMMSKD